MDTKRLMLIVNPISGTSNKKELVPKLEVRLTDAGFEVTTRFTKCRGDATRIADDAVRCGYDAVATCGGDGTVNEVARALCGTGMPMAIIPSGSGNGLARHIGLAADELGSVSVIKAENITDCDYGIANGQKFFCAFGLGFDAAVAKKFAEDGHRGLLTYLKNTVKEFARYQPKRYTITVDGKTSFDRKAYLVACCNASQYGNNAFIAPDASITDGLFDVIILRDASHIQTLLAGLDMMTGMLTHNHQVEIIKARTVDIKVHDQTPAHLDGEPLDPQSDIHIEMVPGQLKLFTDKSHMGVTPFFTPIDNMARDISASISKIFR